jgi:uncharacterized membrane protein
VIEAALYLQATPVGNVGINGQQARYFLPILPLMALPVLETVSLDDRNPQRISRVLLCITAEITMLWLLLDFAQSIY